MIFTHITFGNESGHLHTTTGFQKANHILTRFEVDSKLVLKCYSNEQLLVVS